MQKRWAIATVAAIGIGVLLLAAVTKIDYVTQIQRAPSADPRTFVWTIAQSAAISSGSNTITLSPCPAGFSTAAVIPVLLSGGTGATEAPNATVGVISGGNCPISFTAANGHSGAWGVGSASSGIGEAIAAAIATGSNWIAIPGSSYAIWAPITIASPMTIECAANAVLSAQTATGDILVINNAASGYRGGIASLRGCTFDSAVVRSGGAAIALGGTNVNAGTVIDSVNITHQWDGIRVESAYGYSIVNNFITGNGNYDISVLGVLQPDGTDGIIANNFIGASSGPVNVYLEQMGGVKIIGNKIVNGTTGIKMLLPSSSTSLEDLMIANNSIEGHSLAGIWVNRVGAPGGYLDPVHITGNQINGMCNGSDTAILLQSPGVDNKATQDAVIDSNVITFSSTAINAVAQYVDIRNNHITLAGCTPTSAIITTGSQNLVVQNNSIYNTTTPYTMAADTLLTDTTTGIAFASLPAVKNGSWVYCTDCNSGCTAGSSSGQICKRLNGAWTN